ncbi:hypothetical protein BN2476_1140004 [Paraburkholderia piptadeniae]|uniref:Uncharacterized protein n=1 Tax=Paraburkholderia piptadeniae TaxID=1701573 RepID=A0A1N7SV42_9BURK|nr:hypothetical protein BN2476_1140004 [Paraburkholderia piptadeniae]
MFGLNQFLQGLSASLSLRRRAGGNPCHCQADYRKNNHSAPIHFGFLIISVYEDRRVTVNRIAKTCF